MDNSSNPRKLDRPAAQGAPQEPQPQDVQPTPSNQVLLDSFSEFDRKFGEGIEVLPKVRATMNTEVRPLRENNPVSETEDRLNRASANSVGCAVRVVVQAEDLRNVTVKVKQCVSENVNVTVKSEDKELMVEVDSGMHSLDKVPVKVEQCVSENMVGVDSESAWPNQKTIGDGVESERKRTMAQETVPEAKKAKKEVLFVIFGVIPREYPNDHMFLIMFLDWLGFQARNKQDIVANAPISTKLLKPELLLKFAVLSSSTETELLGWLSNDANITQMYLANKKAFGLKVTCYRLITNYSDIEEVRAIHFMMLLMQKHKVQNTLENFKSLTTKDFEKMETMLFATPRRILQNTLKVFSIEGRQEIIDAFVKLTQVPQSFWIGLTTST